MDFLKHLIGQPKKCIIHEKLDQQLLLNHIIFICYPYNQYLTRLLYQIMFFSKIHPAENGSTRAIPENLPFFLDVTSKLFQHISELNNVCEEICKVEIDKLAKLQGLFGES